MSHYKWLHKTNPDNHPREFCNECRDYTDEVHEVLDSFCNRIGWICDDCKEEKDSGEKDL